MNVTGKMTRLYLSMSEAVMPNILFRSFMSHSGFGGGGAGGGGRGWGGGGGGIGGSCGGCPKGGGPTLWWGCIGGGASSSYRPPPPRIPYFPPAGPYRLMVFSRELPLQCILGSCTLKWTVCKEKKGKKSLTFFGIHVLFLTYPTTELVLYVGSRVELTQFPGLYNMYLYMYYVLTPRLFSRSKIKMNGLLLRAISCWDG